MPFASPPAQPPYDHRSVAFVSFISLLLALLFIVLGIHSHLRSLQQDTLDAFCLLKGSSEQHCSPNLSHYKYVPPK